MKRGCACRQTGFLLIEVLVTIGIFSILAVLVTQTVAFSLKGSRKTEAIGEVRANLDYAIQIMERQLRNAKSVSCSSFGTKIEYTDQLRNSSYFKCDTATGFIASGSEDLALTDKTIVDINDCHFTCSVKEGVPDSIDIILKGVDKKSTGAEGAEVSVQTKILLRTYR